MLPRIRWSAVLLLAYLALVWGALVCAFRHAPDAPKADEPQEPQP